MCLSTIGPKGWRSGHFDFWRLFQQGPKRGSDALAGRAQRRGEESLFWLRSVPARGRCGLGVGRHKSLRAAQPPNQRQVDLLRSWSPPPRVASQALCPWGGQPCRAGFPEGGALLVQVDLCHLTSWTSVTSALDLSHLTP